MAGLTHNGTVVSIPQAELPTGYTKPVVTEFEDYEQKYTSRTMTIAKLGVAAATALATFTALMAQLNTDIETLLGADFTIATLDVTSYAVLKSVSTDNKLAGALYTSDALNYLLVVDIYVKTA
jgi:hypothetical protein